jgi:hypothetical protein
MPHRSQSAPPVNQSKSYFKFEFKI